VSIRSVVSVAGVVLILASCAPASTSEPAQTAASPNAIPAASSAVPSRTPSQVPGPTEAEIASTLRFSATTVDGKRFDGASLAGKPALLWFWAPWCPVCRGQVSQVEKIARDHKGALAVVGVGSLDDADAIRAFAEDVTDTHLVDESGAVWKHFQIKEQSSYVLLDASGDKVFSSGYGGTDEVEERVADVVR
jgi:thiol-disulfide isomerase/thioredoxin